jgi:CheY-like chemotaxis protein
VDQKKAHILCVEDNADSREMLLTVLEGYEVVTAGNVGEGLCLAKTGHCNPQLIDSKLPDGSGIELRRRFPAFDKRFPVLSSRLRQANRPFKLHSKLEHGNTWPTGAASPISKRVSNVCLRQRGRFLMQGT